MNTTHTRTKRLLVTAIGAAVVGISIAAAPAAVAEKSEPNAGNHIPITAGDLYPQPAPWHILPPPGGHPQGGWGPR
jgi:hypothetical protein